MNTELHHLAAAYALGALEAEERDAFEIHYPGCDICSVEVVEFALTAAVLGERSLVHPRSEVRSVVMDRIAKTRQLSPLVEPPTLSVPRMGPGDAITGPTKQRVATLASKGVPAAGQWRASRLGRTVLATAAALLLVVAGAIVVGNRAEEPDLFAQLLDAPDAELTPLEGETGIVQVVWSPSLDRVAVLASSMPDPGAGMTYELWFLLEGGVVRAGLFAPGESGEVRHSWDVEDLDANGWGVTIEPVGGSDSPTSEVLYVGTL